MSEVSNIPQLRFPEFSGEWEDGKLGNYGNLINGLTYSPDNIVDEGLLVLRSSNVQNGQIYLNDNVYVNLDVDDTALTREDDILICVRNGSKRLIGKSTIINKNLPKSTHGAFMTVFRGESNKFISHWFHSSIYYKEVHKNLGATINSINGSDLKKFKTIFPLKPEQQRIAAFLTAVDNKIEQLSKKQALLGEYKKGLMQQIFSQAIRFKSDDGGTFPDWEEKNGNEIFDNISNKNHDSDLPILAITQEHGAIPRDLINYKMIVSDKSVSSYKVVETGDFIISLRSFQGGIEYSNYKGICSPAYIILRPAIEIEKKFYKYYLKTYRYIQDLNRKLEGIRDGKMVSYKYFSEIKLPYPSISEQAKIANFLSSIDNKIEQVGKQLDESKQFKKALLQQMFV